ncbi:acyl carrier protein [Alteromonadaceae bacterium 2753L.S.0a.02]|nr:acyl carrier protein [Alteromonadaceae bacterium 2753L.S.0a.02]
MSGLTQQELEFAGYLVEALDLEDVQAEDIKPEAPLFGFDTEDSLGLDSIDALEISLMIAQKYNVQLKADDSDNEKIFSSLRALYAHVSSAAN